MRNRTIRNTVISTAALAALVLPVAPGALAADATASGAAAATAVNADIRAQLLAIPGMRLIEERPTTTGHRFFTLAYKQPVDHNDPAKGTFEQRITVLHKGYDRPTVFSTGGYSLPGRPGPSRAEPTQLVDGNQVSMEYRYFGTSNPQKTLDLATLNAFQGASDQHRIYEALTGIYSEKWISTGASKGGMTATHYEYYYPQDMDGVVAYVAPNDADKPGDQTYLDFIMSRGTEECRTALANIQIETLERRETFAARYAAEGYTFTETVGSPDAGLEALVLDLPWAFWQYAGAADCANIPDAATATDDEIWSFLDNYGGFWFYNDQGLSGYTTYYYQAGTELGAPIIYYPYLEGLLKHDIGIREYVDKAIPLPAFDKSFTMGVDRFVRTKAENVMFIYGENDPWGAERFRPASDEGAGHDVRDNHLFVAPNANHGAKISGLTTADKAEATAAVLRYAGLADALTRTPPRAQAAYDAQLDSPEPTVRGGRIPN